MMYSCILFLLILVAEIDSFGWGFGMASVHHVVLSLYYFVERKLGKKGNWSLTLPEALEERVAHLEQGRHKAKYLPLLKHFMQSFEIVMTWWENGKEDVQIIICCC